MGQFSFPAELMFWTWAGAAVAMYVLWVAHRRIGNAVLADWGFCVLFAIASVVAALQMPGDPLRRTVVGAMGAIYGGRLAWHLWAHRLHRQREDPRYHALRRSLGVWESWGIFAYFQGQALALVCFLLPLMVLMNNPAPWCGAWEVLGGSLWIGAMSLEALADYQLAVFRQDVRNRGHTYAGGLWRYSRHPNYFFEGLVWCAYAVMALGVPGGWLTLIAPVVMIVALLKVSGVPWAEAQALAARGATYRAYQAQTNRLIPWFPKTRSLR